MSYVMRKLAVILLLVLITVGSHAGQEQNKPKVHSAESSTPALVFGTAWYPEQWDEARWERDLSLMQAAGINMVRVAEFAWSRMEPREGQFDFAWLDRAIELASKHNITIVLGTPSAAPPAWLTYKYPDTLATWDNGRRAEHGNRGHYRFTSTRYLDLARRLASEMAKRYGHNPNVIGWQIDNEYGPVSYDDETRAKFQAWLKQRYQRLESLNRAWSTSYWSQTYDDWAEVPIPVGYHNPSLMLEWRRFVTETFRAYQHNQVQVIRAKADPRQFITHNFMGFDSNFDHYVLSRELDFSSWDNYVGSGHMDPLWIGQVHDLTRGFKRRNFWVMETQPGSVNWAGVNNALDRGEVRRMAWNAIGHGADAIAYWQWRSAPGGQEQYHGSLVGADGNPRPVYEEVSQIRNEFARVADVIQGTAPAAQTAILFDYDSRWAVEFQRHHKDFDPVNYLHTFYRPLRTLTQDVDIVHPSAPLSQYKLVVAPALNVLSDDIAKHLSDYVRSGGRLVLGVRTGMKDVNNALLPSRQPGKLLADLLGGSVVDFYALEKNVAVSGDVAKGEARIWAETLQATPGTDVLLRYAKSNGWLDDQPAIITRRVGTGRITYVGAQFDDSVMRALARWMVEDAGIPAVLNDVPEGVEVCRRLSKNKQVLILINHTAQRQSIPLAHPMRELLKNTDATAALVLEPSDVAVLVNAGK
jgi:beta-galactosidase